MAIFRIINTNFWEDSKIVDDFTPEDKYFYLYLMTNPHTNQLGCYALTIRQIEFETGYNKDTVLKLIKQFSENLNVIFYDEDTKEILIKNWHKYNWTSSPKVIACILKEYTKVKSIKLQGYLDTVLIQYGYNMDTVSIQNHNKNKNNNKNKEEEEKSIIDSISKFKKPTIEEIKKYCLERKNNIDSEKFYNYYESIGWLVGKSKMKNWQAAIRTWEQNQQKYNKQTIFEQEEKADYVWNPNI